MLGHFLLKPLGYPLIRCQVNRMHEIDLVDQYEVWKSNYTQIFNAFNVSYDLVAFFKTH